MCVRSTVVDIMRPQPHVRASSSPSVCLRSYALSTLLPPRRAPYTHMCVNSFVKDNVEFPEATSHFQKQLTVWRFELTIRSFELTIWSFTEEFQVLLGKYADTQPQRYLQTQPREKRKKGFLSGLPLPLPSSLPACLLFFRQCPHARLCVLSNYDIIFLLVLITHMRY